jgi:ATP-binding cassette subfamily A (ABC1) protein 3
MTTSAFAKFNLLLWKNWKIQLRHKVQTFFEIFIPVACCAILILVRGLADIEDIKQPTYYRPIPVNSLEHVRNKTWRDDPPVIFRLAYSPINKVLEKLVAKAAEQLQIDYLGIENSGELKTKVMDLNILCGIEFEDQMKVLF